MTQCARKDPHLRVHVCVCVRKYICNAHLQAWSCSASATSSSALQRSRHSRLRPATSAAATSIPTTGRPAHSIIQGATGGTAASSSPRSQGTCSAYDATSHSGASSRSAATQTGGARTPQPRVASAAALAGRPLEPAPPPQQPKYMPRGSALMRAPASSTPPTALGAWSAAPRHAAPSSKPAWRSRARRASQAQLHCASSAASLAVLPLLLLLLLLSALSTLWSWWWCRCCCCSPSAKKYLWNSKR